MYMYIRAEKKVQRFAAHTMLNVLPSKLCYSIHFHVCAYTLLQSKHVVINMGVFQES